MKEIPLREALLDNLSIHSTFYTNLSAFDSHPETKRLLSKKQEQNTFYFFFIFCNFNIKNNSYNNSRFPKRGGVGEARRVSSSCLHFAQHPFLAPSVFVIVPSPFFLYPSTGFTILRVCNCVVFFFFFILLFTVNCATCWSAHKKGFTLLFFCFVVVQAVWRLIYKSHFLDACAKADNTKKQCLLFFLWFCNVPFFFFA